MGPCIVIDFYSKTNKNAQFFEFIEYHSTCFGRFVDCMLACSQPTCMTYT